MKNIKRLVIALISCAVAITILCLSTFIVSARPAWGSYDFFEDKECTKGGYINNGPPSGEEKDLEYDKDYYFRVFLTDNLLFPFYCDDVIVGKDVIIKGNDCVQFTEGGDNYFSPQICQYGDVDDVWDVDTADALSILKRCAKMDNDGIIHEKSADVDQNGEINTLDSLEILKRITRLVEWERKDETVSSFNFIVKE